MPGNDELLSFELRLVCPIQCREINTYSDSIEVGLNYTSVEIFCYSNWIQLANVEESSTAVIGDKHQAGWKSIGDKAMKMT